MNKCLIIEMHFSGYCLIKSGSNSSCGLFLPLESKRAGMEEAPMAGPRYAVSQKERLFSLYPDNVKELISTLHAPGLYGAKTKSVSFPGLIFIRNPLPSPVLEGNPCK